MFIHKISQSKISRALALIFCQFLLKQGFSIRIKTDWIPNMKHFPEVRLKWNGFIRGGFCRKKSVKLFNKVIVQKVKLN